MRNNMRLIILFSLTFDTLRAAAKSCRSTIVKTGLDVLIESDDEQLAGEKVILLTTQQG